VSGTSAAREFYFTVRKTAIATIAAVRQFLRHPIGTSYPKEQ